MNMSKKSKRKRKTTSNYKKTVQRNTNGNSKPAVPETITEKEKPAVPETITEKEKSAVPKNANGKRRATIKQNTIGNPITNKKWLAMILPLLICVFGYFFISKIVPEMSLFCKEYTICDASEEEISLTDDILMEQEFEMPFDVVSGLDVYFKRADANWKGKIKMQLVSQDGTALYTWKMREDLLEEDGYQAFSMNQLMRVDKGEHYTLRIYSEDNDDAVAKVAVSADNVYKEGSLTIDGAKQKQDLAFKVLGRCDGAGQKSLFVFIYAVFAALFVVCFYAITQKKVSYYMQSVNGLDWVLFGVVAVASALLFSQYTDLEITVKHSEDLISIMKDGKFFQFYDIVLDKAMDGGYGAATFLNAANYNIFLYLALSIIIVPFVLIRKLFALQYDYSLMVAYVQCVLLLLDMVAAKLVAKVCEAFGADRNYAKIASYLFLSSSVTIFATVGFGQLDIIYIIVLLVSLLFFAKEQYYRFSLVISVAIMLKSFPILFFVPLILLTHKKVWQIFVHMVLGVSSSLVFKVLFGATEGYRITKEKMNAFYNFMERLVNCNIYNGYSAIALFLVVYVILCIWAYSKQASTRQKRYSHMIWIGLCVYGAFAILTLWHPQWLVILALFMTLAIMQFTNQKLALYCDLGVQIMYIAASNIYFVCNVDNYMVNHGILPWMTGHQYEGAPIIQIAERIDNLLPMVFSVLVGILITFIYYAYKRIEEPKLSYKELQCERLVVWVRLAVMYAYCLMLCVFFFYLG